MKRIAVKIGSNVLTRRDGTLDITRMSAIVDQVAELHKRGMQVILAAHPIDEQLRVGLVGMGDSIYHELDERVDDAETRQFDVQHIA